MGNNYDTANEYVVGVYQEKGKPAHALTKSDNHYTYIGPLKTVCGHVSDIQYDSPCAKPIEAGISHISDVTCKKCLQVLENKGIITPKAKEDEPIKLLGIYSYNDVFPTHALIRRELKAHENLKVGIPTLRSVCNAYPEVYRPDNSPTGNKAILRKVTCEHCLDELKRMGLSQQPAQKKFFLVFYDGGEVNNVYDFEELLQDAHRFKPTINKILLVESYKEISVKETVVVVDENGNEITEEDI